MDSQRQSITVSSEDGLTSWASGEHDGPGAFAGALAKEAEGHATSGTAIVASTGPTSQWQLIAAPGYVLAHFLNVKVT